MKLKFTMSCVAIIVALLISPKTGNSQVKYLPGYVIMLNGDTLKGELKKNLKKEFENYTRASYRQSEGAVIKNFKTDKVKEYMIGGETFVSRTVDGELVFVKRLVEGIVNLYEAQLEVVEMNDIEVMSYYFMERNDGEFVRIKSGKFKKQIAEALADNQEIVKDVEANKYTYKNLVELFTAYNTSAVN